MCQRAFIGFEDLSGLGTTMSTLAFGGFSGDTAQEFNLLFRQPVLSLPLLGGR
ncbi:hypothetical protein J2R99_002845 [Rhodopseudomonas julia]|uniref:Uncharacterized protein n=1 Tax=Rhodopseudomonas julia TaxID=200617 RepID=A0ABU0CAN4_9BRAD|nr:hypothetical protein [Rhodopseudomonas julia]